MKLKLWRYDLKLRHTWTIASNQADGGKTSHPVVFVELEDKHGRKGIGEASPSRRYHESAETVVAFLQKVKRERLSFDDIPGSMAYLETLSHTQFAAKTALNLALLDGACKAAHKPVYDYLGLGFAEGLHPTSFSIGIASPSSIKEKVQAAAAFPILKLKVGSPRDRENLAALRSVAPRKKVRVDANEAWRKKEEALAQIQELAKDPHIEFIEQPMPASSSVLDMKWLKERSPLPLFADESCRNPSDVERCVACFHGVNVKLVKTRGLTGAYEILTKARKFGMMTMLGCMIESSLLISAAAHLAELTDCLDLDGNLLITNDPYEGVTAEKGLMSFSHSEEKYGLRVISRGHMIQFKDLVKKQG